MQILDLFRKLGIYVEESFLDPELCASLRKQMDMSPRSVAKVYLENIDSEHIDTQIRRTEYCDLPTNWQQLVSEKIYALKPCLENFFNESFAKIYEEPKYLQYHSGHYFSPHTDGQANRRINISLYLNNQTSTLEKQGYVGGELKLYDLIQSPGWKNRSLIVPGIEGMLIAYPAETIHEVTPVESGCRYAVVSRFLAPSADSIKT